MHWSLWFEQRSDERIYSHLCKGFISKGKDGPQSLLHESRFIVLKMRLNSLSVSEFSSLMFPDKRLPLYVAVRWWTAARIVLSTHGFWLENVLIVTVSVACSVCVLTKLKKAMMYPEQPMHWKWPKIDSKHFQSITLKRAVFWIIETLLLILHSSSLFMLIIRVSLFSWLGQKQGNALLNWVIWKIQSLIRSQGVIN